jgi:hypothetical protein
MGEDTAYRCVLDCIQKLRQQRRRARERVLGIVPTELGGAVRGTEGVVFKVVRIDGLRSNRSVLVLLNRTPHAWQVMMWPLRDGRSRVASQNKNGARLQTKNDLRRSTGRPHWRRSSCRGRSPGHSHVEHRTDGESWSIYLRGAPYPRLVARRTTSPARRHWC